MKIYVKLLFYLFSLIICRILFLRKRESYSLVLTYLNKIWFTKTNTIRQVLFDGFNSVPARLAPNIQFKCKMDEARVGLNVNIGISMNCLVLLAALYVCKRNCSGPFITHGPHDRIKYDKNDDNSGNGHSSYREKPAKQGNDLSEANTTCIQRKSVHILRGPVHCKRNSIFNDLATTLNYSSDLFPPGHVLKMITLLCFVQWTVTIIKMLNSTSNHSITFCLYFFRVLYGDELQRWSQYKGYFLPKLF